jgi:phage terminase large subunit GpA-like protein
VKLPGHERNEALDCRNYATAALRVLDPDMDKVEERLRQKTKPITQDQPRQAPKRKKVNRALSGDDW